MFHPKIMVLLIGAETGLRQERKSQQVRREARICHLETSKSLLAQKTIQNGTGREVAPVVAWSNLVRCRPGITLTLTGNVSNRKTILSGTGPEVAPVMAWTNLALFHPGITLTLTGNVNIRKIILSGTGTAIRPYNQL
jgi:hypothetical protein